MMAKADWNITFEIEPICKVTCIAQNCKFNLIHHKPESYYCSLKYIDVDELGRCGMFDPIGKVEAKTER